MMDRQLDIVLPKLLEAMAQIMTTWDIQDGFDMRFDWGPGGVLRLAPHVSTIVIVDVLRFSTAVENAVSAGITIYPYRWGDTSAAEFARSVSARLAGEQPGSPSPSSQSILSVERGSSLVLPSQNGAPSALLAAEVNPDVEVVAGCLRNAAAVSLWLQTRPPPIAVIACGEIADDGSLRPAVEDLLASGAILSPLGGSRSPEAAAAKGAFLDANSNLEAALILSASGRELIGRSLATDVSWAANINVSQTVPVLRDGAFRA